MRLQALGTVLSVFLVGCLVPVGISSTDEGEPGNENRATDKSHHDDLPPPIHDEREVLVGVGKASGGNAECSDIRPCFEYPFTLKRPAMVWINATRGDPAHGIAVELLGGSQQLWIEATGVNAPPIAYEQVLEPGNYLVRVHAFRMVNGAFVIDVNFQEPTETKGKTRLDPLLDQQWGLPMSRVPEAWLHATGKGVVIAIIDSGIDLTHPDLVDKLVLVDGAAIVGDSLQDSAGHGTHAAGIAAASGRNGIGIAGVAPDARIMPIRIFDTVSNEDPTVFATVVTEEVRNDIAMAIRLAADNGADVISLSLAAHLVGGETLPVLAPQVQEAIDYAWSKGLVLVASAGNGYVGPQCADVASHPHVLCVGAVMRDGQRGPYSNLVVPQEFVVAPGGWMLPNCEDRILSTVPNGEVDCAQKVGDAWYGGMHGTSMSAPFAAGVAALLVEQGLSNQEVLERIKDTASPTIGSEDQLPDPNPVYGLGLVDALCAVTDGAGPGCG